MEKFLVLYMATKEQQAAWASADKAEQEKGMAEWVDWMKSHQDAWVDEGNPTGRNHRVDQSGTNEQQNEVCGYSIVQAPSAAAVAAMFEGSPHLSEPNTWVEVMPIVNMM